MRPEQIDQLGTALRERVRSEVDTGQRLELMLRANRRRRVVLLATAAAAALAFAVGILSLVDREPPVVTSPTTTIPLTTTIDRGRPLSVEVFMVLRGDYVVDDSTGFCEGAGPLDGIGQGSLVHVFDESVYSSADDSPTIALPAGVEVTRDDESASYLLGRDEAAGCVFELGDLGFDIREFDGIQLFPVADPDVSMGSRISGQRVIYGFGESR